MRPCFFGVEPPSALLRAMAVRIRPGTPGDAPGREHQTRAIAVIPAGHPSSPHAAAPPRPPAPPRLALSRLRLPLSRLRPALDADRHGSGPALLWSGLGPAGLR